MPDQIKLAYRKREAAAALGVSVSTINNYLKIGKLRGRALQGPRGRGRPMVVIPAEDLRRLLDEAPDRALAANGTA